MNDYEELLKNNEYKNESNHKNNFNKKLYYVIAIVILIIIFILLYFFIINKKEDNTVIDNNKPVKEISVNFIDKEITITVGESKKINYNIINSNNNPVLTSSNEEIISIQEDYIYGKSKGETYITITLTEDGKTYQDTCKVLVNEVVIEPLFCNLKLLENGDIEASVSSNATSYGFDKTEVITGNVKELKKNIETDLYNQIKKLYDNKFKEQESKSQSDYLKDYYENPREIMTGKEINYYVKNSNGDVETCSIKVNAKYSCENFGVYVDKAGILKDFTAQGFKDKYVKQDKTNNDRLYYYVSVPSNYFKTACYDSFTDSVNILTDHRFTEHVTATCGWSMNNKTPCFTCNYGTGEFLWFGSNDESCFGWMNITDGKDLEECTNGSSASKCFGKARIPNECYNKVYSLDGKCSTANKKINEIYRESKTLSGYKLTSITEASEIKNSFNYITKYPFY